MYLDFMLEPGARLDQPIPESWNGFVYILSGTALFGKAVLQSQRLSVL